MKKWKGYLLPGALALLVAVVAAMSVNRHPAYNILFHLGLDDKRSAERILEDTIKQFNRDLATLFNTGGATALLSKFPADSLIIRRAYQEVRFWDQRNMVMVYDKDLAKIESIRQIRPDAAIVVSREIWYISAHDAVTRERLSTLKRCPERVRYILRLVGTKWKVVDYEVYDEKDDIPLFNEEIL